MTKSDLYLNNNRVLLSITRIILETKLTAVPSVENIK